MNDEDIPYRTPVPAMNPGPSQVSSSQDAENYNTLKAVQKALADSIDSLSKDFNAFEILKGENLDKVKEDLYAQVAGKQIAYDILAPLLESINSAIQTVDNQYNKQR